jgi:ATP-dependent Clp protease ATP-binding subunit ClpA
LTRLNVPSSRARRHEPEDLAAQLAQRIVGQDEAVEAIAPYVQLFQAGLAPEGRPVGVFLLLGPTGTGKTRTVEALADTLHGSEKNVLRIDCGEFQMEHEVAKLIGAPPGYLGHRETQPMLNQHKLNAVTSERSGLSLVLFDEVEKAAISLGRLLLGVLDKASLRLGDNTSVNFERSLIFLTSNLGAREMLREMQAGFGYGGLVPKSGSDASSKLQAIAMNAVRRRFSPEFVNRIDRTLTYRPLEREQLNLILDQQLDLLRRHVQQRLLARAYEIEVTKAAREFLLDRGTGSEFGARELKRTIHRFIMQPMAALVAAGGMPPGGVLRVHHSPSRALLSLEPVAARRRLPDAA